MRDNCLSGPKYCPHCGKELEKYDLNCRYCGAELIQNKVKIRKRKKYNESNSNLDSDV